MSTRSNPSTPSPVAPVSASPVSAKPVCASPVSRMSASDAQLILETAKAAKEGRRKRIQNFLLHNLRLTRRFVTRRSARGNSIVHDSSVRGSSVSDSSVQDGGDDASTLSGTDSPCVVIEATPPGPAVLLNAAVNPKVLSKATAPASLKWDNVDTSVAEKFDATVKETLDIARSRQIRKQP